MYNNKNLNLNFKFNQFLFNSMLLFLVFICFINSFFMSIEYIWTFQRDEFLLLFLKIVFIFLLIAQFFYPVIINYLISFFLSKPIIDYCRKLRNFTDKYKEEYPFLTFLVFYSYGCVFFLYWFTFFVTEMDIFITLMYCFFNIIKLFFFPLVITGYIYVNRQYVMSPLGDEIASFSRNADEIVGFATKINSYLKNIIKKNPKTTVAFTGAAFATAAMSVQGHGAKNYIITATNNPHIPFMTEQKLQLIQNLRDSQIAKELYSQSVTILMESEQRAIRIGYNDFLNVLQGQPTLAERFCAVVKDTTSIVAENSQSAVPLSEATVQQIREETRRAVLEELRKEKAGALGDLAASRSLQEPEISDPQITSTALVGKSDVVSPSCLEEILFNF